MRGSAHATRSKTPQKASYDEDFYVRAEREAELLRSRRFDEACPGAPVLEVEGWADVERSAALNNAGVAVEHLLMVQHSRAQDPRKGWRASAIEHRARG
jgi:hypothetical protein